MENAVALQSPPFAAPTFEDLPDEVLALTVAVGLTKASDVASFAATSKRCAAVCKAAPLCLAVPVRPSTPSQEQAEARAALQALCSSWPGIAALDLRGCPVEDEDVMAALAALSNLDTLQLSGCKKLTPALPAALGADAPQLSCVTLQRCFQLTSRSLTDVLWAAAHPACKLRSAALSHLSLLDWPQQLSTPLIAQLHMLALHNCGKLSGDVLRCIAACCPHLEVLMLGGAAFVPDDNHTSSPCDGDKPPSSSLGQLLPESGMMPLRDRATAAVLEAAPRLGAASSSIVGGIAADLGELVCRLPQLRVLELTFTLPGLAAAVRHLALTEPALRAAQGQTLQVWDLTTPSSIQQALAWQQELQRGKLCSRGGKGAAFTPADAATFLQAAVNCSSAARQTALHAAAEEGNAGQLQALLHLGAAVDARDRSGATPLFVACEAGHLLGTDCLLRAGADVTLKNSAGEGPLYIAALKGHERVLDLLLQHCHDKGISWQAHRDGDSWTPLMAAAVGGRTSIVVKLLRAAGEQAGELVSAANRYGQTTLHIAARKGSASLLKALVDAGGAATLLSPDADGRTAAEIARNMRNGSALRVLADASGVARREQQRQRGTIPTAERPRANDHRQHVSGSMRWVGRRLAQRKSAPA